MLRHKFIDSISGNGHVLWLSGPISSYLSFFTSLLALPLSLNCLSFGKLILKLPELFFSLINFVRERLGLLVKLKEFLLFCLQLSLIFADLLIQLSILRLDLFPLMGHLEGDLALLVDVFLSEIDSTFDTLDIFMRPIQSLALCLNFLKLIYHKLPLFDALINDIIKLGYELLNVTLHLMHSLLISSLDQIAFNLPFVPRKL